MSRKLYWGSAALIVILIAAGGFIYWQWSEVQQLKEEVALNDKLIGHFHADGSFHEGPHEEDPSRSDLPKVKPSVEVPKKTSDVPKPQPKKLYTGPLTFHAELLKTNPVKALRLQQEERGHWSAEWIPPFPPEDTEAQEFARVRYLKVYYWQTFGKKLDTPEYEKEAKEYDKASAISNQMWDIIISYPYGARKYDLLKLSWPSRDKEPVTSVLQPSEYFGDAEARDLLKQLGTWKY